MTQTDTAAFPVHWDDPADAQRTWEFDAMHCPFVGTPLGFDLYMEPFLRGFGMIRACQQNYYAFMCETLPAGQPSPAAEPDAIKQGGRRWREEILPEVLALTEHYRKTAFEGMSSAELAAEVDRLVDARVRCGQLHTMATMPWWLGMSLLIDTCHELTGGDDLLAVRLVQGYGSKSTEAGRALWQVARVAASIPASRSSWQTRS